jgi:hypothetical protein
MPVHDWTRVPAGIFHHFRLCWLNPLMRTLNQGGLPSDCYALTSESALPPGCELPALEEPELYALKACSAVIRRTSNHEVIAICEIVSPGNKRRQPALRSFVDKAVFLLRSGIHLVVLDVFPPGPHDPQGIHNAIWEGINDNAVVPPADRPLTLVSYIGGQVPTAFVEPTAVGAELPEMPLFLTPKSYVPLPLEATYDSAWENLPVYWRDVLTAPRARRDPPDTPERPQS